VFGILILGGGPVLGGALSGWLQARYTLADGLVDFGSLWRVVAVIGLFSTVVFVTLFRDGPKRNAEGRAGATGPG
jgi:hypothetical protein